MRAKRLSSFLGDWQRAKPGAELDHIEVIAAFVLLGQCVDNEMRDLAHSRYKLRTGDLRMLLALRRRGSDAKMRPTDLFKSLLITSGAVTKQADRLLKKRLIARIPDPGYQRGKLIKLTPAGKRIADEVFDITTQSFGSLGGAIAKCDKRTREQGVKFLDFILAELNGSESQETTIVRRGRPRSGANGNSRIVGSLL